MSLLLAEPTKLNKKTYSKLATGSNFYQTNFLNFEDARYLHLNTEKLQSKKHLKLFTDKEFKKNSEGRFQVKNELTFDLSQSSGSELVYKKLSIFHENFELLKGLQFIGLFQKCMWRLSKDSKVKVTGDYIDLSEFRRCNHQNCPICSIRVNLPKRHKINKLVELNNYHQDGSILFLTLTGYHYKTFDQSKHFDIMQKSLSELLESSDWNYDRSSLKHKSFRSINSIKSTLDIDFMYSAHDYTFSEKYGNHNHFHIMIACCSRLDSKKLEQVENRIKYLWQEIYSKNTRHYYKQGSAYNQAFQRHSVMLLDSTGDYKKVSKYLTNELPLSKELTSINGKKTKLETSHNLRDLYNMLLYDKPQIERKKLIAIVHDYMRTTERKRLGKFICVSSNVREQIKNLNIDMKESRQEFIKSNQKKFNELESKFVFSSINQLKILFNLILISVLKNKIFTSLSFSCTEYRFSIFSYYRSYNNFDTS